MLVTILTYFMKTQLGAVVKVRVEGGLGVDAVAAVVAVAARGRLRHDVRGKVLEKYNYYHVL